MNKSKLICLQRSHQSQLMNLQKNNFQNFYFHWKMEILKT